MQELKLEKPDIEKTMNKENANVSGTAIPYANPKGKITTEAI